jgi:hypothetical protein
METLGGLALHSAPATHPATLSLPPSGTSGSAPSPPHPARYARALALGLAMPSRGGTRPAKLSAFPRDETLAVSLAPAREQAASRDRRARLPRRPSFCAAKAPSRVSRRRAHPANDHRLGRWEAGRRLCGKVLVAGVECDWAQSAELYDPAVGTFTATGSMTVATPPDEGVV